MPDFEHFPCRRVHVRPYGERGYLLSDLSAEARVVLDQALALNPPQGYAESVPGHTNVLILFEAPIAISALENWLSGLPVGGSAVDSVASASRRFDIPVIYDGADLGAVAEATGFSEAEVIAIHCAPEYTVRLMGFAPGFPYLEGLDPRLHLERKASPRNRIEPGAVAIGGSHAGIYSVASPGGWHLLGRTDLQLFSPEHAKGAQMEPREVFLLAPGDTVRFVDAQLV